MPRSCPLTARQLNVLALLALGYDSAAIGGRLNVSEDTVKSHLRRMFRSLGVRNRTHAVTIAFAAGLLIVADHDPDTRRQEP